MSSLSIFMKKNKIQKENTTFPATNSLLGEDGRSLLWTIKPITTRENDEIRESCTVEMPVKGKPNMYRPKLDTAKYIAKMTAASIAEPDLMNAELQDSYGVHSPEDLLREMIDDPGEYNSLASFVQSYSGFDVTMQDKVSEAKN